MAWTEPKVNWIPDDTIDADDFNRIRNNIDYLCQEAKKHCVIDFVLGNEKTYSDIPYVDIWNNLENGLEKIYNTSPFVKFGTKKQYKIYDNYIDAEELNRLEKICKDYKDFFDNHTYIEETLSFKLGNYGGVRI